MTAHGTDTPDVIWEIDDQEKPDGIWLFARYSAEASSPHFADGVCEICSRFSLEETANGVG